MDIALSLLDQYPAFLSEQSAEPGVLWNNPPGVPDVLPPLDRFTPDHRVELAAALTGDMTRWGASPGALQAAALLREPNAYAVVTGQQAGVMTGPLYTLAKAVGAVRAAELLAERFPEFRFVPVFWVEADDHDIAEAATLGVIDSAGAFGSVAYHDGNALPVPVGDRVCHPDAVERFVGELRAALVPTEFTDATLALVRWCYASGDTLADGFARALYALLGPDVPLVLANSRNPRLKGLARDVLAREAGDPAVLSAAVGSRTQALQNAGVGLQIQPKRGGLFYLHKGLRRAMDDTGTGYTVRGTDVQMTYAQAAEQATKHPELFSPNVALRPLVQDAILPTAVYLGGPAELLYLNQIRDAYAGFGMSAPAIAPRPFVMLQEPKVRRVLAAMDMTLEQVLAQGFDPATALLDPELTAQLEAASAQALSGLGQAYARLSEVTAQIDASLVKTLGAAHAGAEKGVQDFTKRLTSAMKKQQGTQAAKLGAVRTMVSPGGVLQERALSPLYYLNKYGPTALHTALHAIRLAPGVMQVIAISEM